MWNKISNNCDEFINTISQYKKIWDEARGTYKNEPYKDWTSHAADVHRYMAIVENLMTNDIHKNKQRVHENRETNQQDRDFS